MIALKYSYQNNNEPYPSLLDEFLGLDIINLLNDFKYAEVTLPAVNIAENTEAFLIEVAVPGLKKEDFKITLQRDILTVAPKQVLTQENRLGKCLHREFNYQNYQRSFVIPNTASRTGIQARYFNGVLQLYIPKKEEAKQQLVQVINVT